MSENDMEYDIKKINAITKETAFKKDYPFYNKGRYSAGFMYTIKGSEIIKLKNQIIKTEPDSLLFFPKGESYRVMLDGEKSEVIVIDFENSNKTAFSHFYVKSNNIGSLESLFVSAEKSWVRKNIGYNYECLSYLYNIIFQLKKVKNNYISNINYKKIENAVNYLHEHYSDADFRIKTLYRISNMSSQYFETLFKNKFSATPKEYLTDLRIKRAKELLLSSKKNMTEISEDLGFCDAYHFSKMFKKATGKTPTEYRNME